MKNNKEENKITATIKTQWDEKFLRETPFMPFGSMMNAYGRINQGKGTTIHKFLEDASNIFNRCQKFVIESFNKMNKEAGEQIELPIKNIKDKKGG